ncbi:hypothetical protein PR003_g33594 [Phytophthora rubi]|uniref:Uncharacterized protein n=1 Tax=Phytophthora rubi TaxID=129364 RepID=A0A6A3G433_9STRA|nr:hypothetical protein PR002_g32692 [Phytophthora rubi]KAE8953142.1 hypothetical protein PR001_g32998 [Phytophthora rubi]KAE9262289.1 hypothetical protein PR003_g33594 [Phytophthora rubi]
MPRRRPVYAIGVGAFLLAEAPSGGRNRCPREILSARATCASPAVSLPPYPPPRALQPARAPPAQVLRLMCSRP